MSRFGSVLFLSILSFTTAAAQSRPQSTIGLGFGHTLALESPENGSGRTVSLALARRLNDVVALRLDVRSQSLRTSQPIECAVPMPSCPDGYRSPRLIYSATLAAQMTPAVLPSPLFAVFGGGVYRSTGASLDRFGTSMGVMAGIGLTPFSSSGRGLGFEIQYHQLFRRLGEIRGTVVSAVTLRF